jgi:hypothetical protein
MFLVAYCVMEGYAAGILRGGWWKREWEKKYL